MDYSLLVGLEPSSDELVLGIIGRRDSIYVYMLSFFFSNDNDFIHCYLFHLNRLHKNVHLGQKAGDYGEKIWYSGRPG